MEPHEDVCLAAEQHDIGMGDWDAAPERNPATGLPYAFTEMPVERHLQQWRDGPRRLMVQSRYAALLASLHGSRLQRRREPQTDSIRAYLEDQRRFQDALVASLDTDPHLLARNHQLLWTWDFLSLALCLDWAPITAHDVPSAADPVELQLTRRSLDPWPFHEPTLTVRCEGRRLHGPYASDDEMYEALEAAPWETIAFELVSG